MATREPAKRAGRPASGGAHRSDGASAASEYLVETVPWPDSVSGAPYLQARLNEFAADGWEVVAILPTTAATSIRSFVNAHASADTTEFAVVLRRRASNAG